MNAKKVPSTQPLPFFLDFGSTPLISSLFLSVHFFFSFVYLRFLAFWARIKILTNSLARKFWPIILCLLLSFLLQIGSVESEERENKLLLMTFLWLEQKEAMNSKHFFPNDDDFDLFCTSPIRGFGQIIGANPKPAARTGEPMSRAKRSFGPSDRSPMQNSATHLVLAAGLDSPPCIFPYSRLGKSEPKQRSNDRSQAGERRGGLLFIGLHDYCHFLQREKKEWCIFGGVWKLD